MTLWFLWGRCSFVRYLDWVLHSEASELDLLEDRDDDDDDDDDDGDNEELVEEDMRDASASDEPRVGDAAEPADIEDEADEDSMDFGF